MHFSDLESCSAARGEANTWATYKKCRHHSCMKCGPNLLSTISCKQQRKRKPWQCNTKSMHSMQFYAWGNHEQRKITHIPWNHIHWYNLFSMTGVNFHSLLRRQHMHDDSLMRHLASDDSQCHHRKLTSVPKQETKRKTSLTINFMIHRVNTECIDVIHK